MADENIPSDDAALMADENSVHPASLDLVGGSDDDDDETEDPTGKGKKQHPSGVFMYDRPKEVLPSRKVRGGGFPGKLFKQTPGAKHIPNPNY